MTDYLQQEKERIARATAHTAHDFHMIEINQLIDKKIDEALKEYSKSIDVDVQTTLNGSPCSMSGLVADIKK